VNDLIKSFTPMAEMMKTMASGSARERMAGMQQLMRQMQNNPTGNIKAVKGNTGKRLTAKEKEEARKKREKEKRKRDKEKRR
jgi:hypothetical protein